MQIIEYLAQQPTANSIKVHSEGYHPWTPFMRKSTKEYTACIMDKWQHEHYMNVIKNDGTYVQATNSQTEYYRLNVMMKGDHTKWVTHFLIGKAILILVRPVEDTSIVLERICILSRNK